MMIDCLQYNHIVGFMIIYDMTYYAITIAADYT